MKISIITATYNSSAHIAGCLASVNGQTYKNIEHIIVDGASTDNTLEIIKSTIPKGQANRVAQLISEPDHGIYYAFNKGIRLATGDIIGFLHSDDLFSSSETLQHIINAFSNSSPLGGGREGASGVYGDLEYVDKQNTSKVIRYWKSKPFNRKNLHFGWMPAHPTLFLKRAVYEKHGEFNTGFNIAADYDFMLRILNDPQLQFAYLPQVITKMRVGGASNKSIQNIIQKSKEDLRAIRKNKVGGWYTLLFKNFRKITQFIQR